MKSHPLATELLEQLTELDSCSLANAIEMFDVRLRNAGFADSHVRCVFGDLPPMLGYAATLRVRTSDPPMEGERYFYRTDWLDHVMSMPSPRVLVIQDMDRHPGLGAFIGDVHANILQTLGCVGVVTNGAVRNIKEVQALRFQMFAGNLSVSHAFAHVFEYGTTVEIGHMRVLPGDLMHGDALGVQTIPLEIAPKIPAVVQRMREEEREIIDLCHSPDFSLEKLREKVAAIGAKRKAFNS